MTTDWRWEVPGYDVRRLLGFGPLGEVWLASRAADHEPVVLRRMVGFAPEQVAAAIAGLPALPEEHVVRLLDAHEVDGEVALVFEYAAGGSLAALVARRGPLSAGQLVTAVAPIAQAVAAAELLGIGHGRITASEVLITADGRPLLDGLGLHSLLGQAGDDLDGLRQLIRALDPDGRHSDLLAAAGTPDAVAAALLRDCPAEPLVGSPVPRVEQRPVARLLVAAVLLLATSIGVAARLVAPSRHDAPVAWIQVLAELDRSRAAAFAHSDPMMLAKVYLAGSAVLAADTERLRLLSAQHQWAQGLVHRVVSVHASGTDTHRVTLVVEQGLAPFALIGPRGREELPAGPVRPQSVVLVETPLGWRISGISS